MIPTMNPKVIYLTYSLQFTFLMIRKGSKELLVKSMRYCHMQVDYFPSLFLFLGFFLFSYNQYRYEIMVGEGAFNYNDDGKKLREEDFTFLKYIKYSGSNYQGCQFGWEYREEIAGTREEANNQLDVSLLFKKIQHLERAVEYMILEKE